MKNIKKPSCIVNFNNKKEIDFALLEAEKSNFISFEESYKKSYQYLKSISIN